MPLRFRKPSAEIAALWARASQLEVLGAPGSWVRHQSMSPQWARATRNAAEQRKLAAVVGGLSRRDLDELLHPGSYAVCERSNGNGKHTYRRGSGAGRSSLLVKRDWERVAVVPFYSAVGEICGCAFADADCVAPTDVVYRAFTWPKNGVREAGLAMLNSAHAPHHRSIEGTVFIFFDLLAAFRIQFHGWPSQHAPIVVAWDDDQYRTEAAWAHLPPVERVLVTATADVRAFRQARLANAKICVDPMSLQRVCNLELAVGSIHIPPTPDDLELIRKNAWQPLGVLNWLRGVATPWRQALHNLLRNMPREEALQFLEQVMPDPWERHQFLANLHYLRGRLNIADPSQTVRVAGLVVAARGDGWYDETTGRKICDPIRLKHLLKPRRGRPRLDGSVTTGGTTYSFTLSPRRVEKQGLLACIRETLKARQVDFPYAYGWSKLGLPIARALHGLAEPDFVDVVGYTDYPFRLPKFGIGHGGRFDDYFAVPIVGPDTPARQLDPPAPLSREGVHPISLNTPETHLFWAVLRLFATMVVAPAVEQPVPGVLLVGTESGVIAEAIRDTFGCTWLRCPRRSDAVRLVERTLQRIAAHRWPAVLEPLSTRKLAAHALHMLPAANCFVPVADVDRSDPRLREWWIGNVEAAAGAALLLREFGSAVLLNYLAEYMRYPHWRWPQIAPWTTELWQHLSTWFGRIGRGRAARRGADRLTQPPEKEPAVLSARTEGPYSDLAEYEICGVVSSP